MFHRTHREEIAMTQPKIVSPAEWLEASRALVAEEKAWTEARDRLAEKRRALPWVKVEKRYLFDDADGPVSLADLFDRRSQLVIYHFMFAPDWEEGCTGCSLLADQVDGPRRHFEHNDVSFVAVSRAPLAKLQAYRWRMGWQFRWVSAASSDFNFDYHVSFPTGARERFYNFETRTDLEMDDLPGLSVFHQDASGAIYHTYSCYGRGGEMFLPVYSWLDIVPKGRNETKNGNLMDWVKRHDRYPDDGRIGSAHRPAQLQKGAA
jgi:predicted dithiol-disulfide oxidoreductase (DUF899 family)